MLDIRRILCPVDFSDASHHALDHAVMIAGWYRARLTALHVRNPAFLIEPPILFAEMGDVPLATLEDIEARLHEWLAPARAAGIDCDVMAAEGNRPAVAIAEHATSLAADVMVLGTHGRSGFERLMLGSVTEKVVRSVACPVITVPPPGVATSRLPFKRLLCGIDFSEPSLAALRYGFSIARESGAHVTLMHVAEFPHVYEIPSERSFDLARYRHAVQEEAERQLRQLVTDDVREWSEPETRVVFGKPYEQILGAATKDRDDLIVLGVHGRNRLDQMLFGSTTNQVVRRATSPVLTLHR
jgi:nucleotide-binding universal stress UspA family protein